MNRRSFIASLAALAVAPRLPAPEEVAPASPQMAFITAELETFSPVVNSPLRRSAWESMSPAEILASVNFMLEQTWRGHYQICPDIILVSEEAAEWLRRWTIPCV